VNQRDLELARNRARDWVSREVGFRLLDARADDRFLASFPRSGSTWLRAVLCNLVVPWGRADPDVFNALIPGVTIRGALRARSLHAPRIISTHMPYRAGLPRAVYLVRDGRDALVSYYHYRILRNGARRDVTFARFFDEHMSGTQGERWHDNATQWIRVGRVELGARLHVVRYEDLLASPLAAVRALCHFLEVDACDPEIEKALRDASLETMRAVEERRMGGPVERARSFYRSGEARNGTRWFDDAMLERFAGEAGDALDLCGYPRRPEQQP